MKLLTYKKNLFSPTLWVLTLFISYFMLFFLLSCKSNNIITPTKHLNFRNKPTTKNSLILRVLKPGETLTVIKREGKWVKIKTEKGEIGWAYSKYLTKSNKTKRRKSKSQRKVGFLKINFKQAWKTIKNWSRLFYLVFFITLGIILAGMLNLNIGAGVAIGFLGYIFTGFSPVKIYQANVALFVYMNIIIVIVASMFSGLIQGSTAEDNPFNYFTGILGPLCSIFFGIFNNINQIYIAYIIALILGIIINYKSILEALEEISDDIRIIGTIPILIGMIALFSAVHMPYIWKPIVFVQGIIALISFIGARMVD